MSTRRQLGELTGISRDTPTRIHSLAVFAECLAVWLACRNQRRLTGNGSALEAIRDDALHRSTYFFYCFFCVLSADADVAGVDDILAAL